VWAAPESPSRVADQFPHSAPLPSPATLTKMAKDAAPGTRLAADAHDAVAACANEFVKLVASEAADAADAAKKNTVGPDHVVAGLKALGFDDFVADVETAAAGAKAAAAAAAKDKAAAKKSAAAAMTEEEAVALQERLFAEARARAAGGVPPPAGPVAPKVGLVAAAPIPAPEGGAPGE